VAAYCHFPEVSTAACARVGRENKMSNAAALRRACPKMSHGWVLHPLIRHVPSLAVRRRAAAIREARATTITGAAFKPAGKRAGGGGASDGLASAPQSEGADEKEREDTGLEGGAVGGTGEGEAKRGADAGGATGSEGGADGSGKESEATGLKGEAAGGLDESDATASVGLDLNVLVLMLDSISAARFKEGMPLTYALLQSWAAPTYVATQAAAAAAQGVPAAVKGARTSAAPTHTPPAHTLPSHTARHNATGVGPAATSSAADPAAANVTAAAAAANATTASGVLSTSAQGWRSFRFEQFVVVGSNSPRNQVRKPSSPRQETRGMATAGM
jgi:hypothetical protein